VDLNIVRLLFLERKAPEEGMKRRAVVLLVCLLSLCVGATLSLEEVDTNGTPRWAELMPDQELMNQKIFHQETLFYQLKQLEPSTQYEVKISYPATVCNITPPSFIYHINFRHQQYFRLTLYLRRLQQAGNY